MKQSFLRYLALYVVVAALVLAYVAVTGSARQAASADAGSALIQRYTIAAVALATWMGLDLLLTWRFLALQAATHYLLRILLGWGMLLALGASLAANNQRFLAAGIVFGVTAAFLGLWMMALSYRRTP